MQQIEGGTTYTDVSPGNVVTSTNLNALTNAATLTNGAVIDQNDVSGRAGNVVPLAADTLLLGDSTALDTGAPLKVRVDSLLLESQRNASLQFAAGSSAGTLGAAYTLTLTPAMTAYAAGQVVRFKADAANAGAVTVNVNAVGVKSVVSRAGVALNAGDILSGQTCEIVYDAGNGWFALNTATPINSVSAADLTEAARDGTYYHESSATTHASGGGFDTYTVTLSPLPTQLITGMRFRFKVPAASGNTQPAKLVLNYVAGSSGAIGFVKKGTALSLPLVVNDLVVGNFAEVVYDGTNFQLMNPAGWDFVSVPTNVSVTGGLVQFAHGLGVVPSKVRVVLVQTNATAQNGYAQNDEIPVEVLYNGSSNPPLPWVADGTNVTVLRNNNNGSVNAVVKTGGAGSDISAGVNTPNFYWKLKVYASI